MQEPRPRRRTPSAAVSVRRGWAASLPAYSAPETEPPATARTSAPSASQRQAVDNIW